MLIVVQLVRINQTSTLDLLVLHLYKLLLQNTLPFDKSSGGQLINMLNYSLHAYSLVNYNINVTELLLIIMSYPI